MERSIEDRRRNSRNVGWLGYNLFAPSPKIHKSHYYYAYSEISIESLVNKSVNKINVLKFIGVNVCVLIEV